MRGGALWLPAATLWWRELVRFVRQRSRVVGALGQPLVFWLVLGLGFGDSFRAPGIPGGSGYGEYFFAGTAVLVVLFTSIFSTFSLIDDRKAGFLQSVLVAPVSPASVALGKILGGTTLSLIQGALFLALAPVAGIRPSAPGFLLALGFLALLAFGLTALGFLLAWRMDSTQGFHAIMNLFLLPLWLLSGAVFPLEGAPAWLRWIMTVNPVRYGVDGVRHGLYLGGDVGGLPPLAICAGVMGGFALLVFVLATFTASRPTGADLR